MIVLIAQLDGEFKKARDDYAAWNQMMTALDLDRKLVDSEVKIYKEMKALLTAEDAHDLVAKMLSIILRVFPHEKKKLRQVQYEFVRLIGDRPIDVQSTEVDEEDEIDGEDESLGEVDNLHEKQP
jgi:hypothetical protein